MIFLVIWLQELLFLFSTFSVRIENITDNTYLLVGTCGGGQNVSSINRTKLT